jgi:hypothetical protein
MTKFPDDDQKLVEFLRKYQPEAPSETNNPETQLMKLIAKQPRPLPGKWWGKKSKRLLWLLPPMLAATGFLFWSNPPLLSPSANIANDTEELDSFLVNSWQDSLDENPDNTSEYTTFDWMMFTYPKSEKSPSQPSKP